MEENTINRRESKFSKIRNLNYNCDCQSSVEGWILASFLDFSLNNSDSHGSDNSNRDSENKKKRKIGGTDLALTAKTLLYYLYILYIMIYLYIYHICGKNLSLK